MRGKITASQLNVRERPDANASKIGVLAQNTIIEILGQNDDWCEIRLDGRPGFVSQRFVALLSQSSPLKAKVNANSLNVRSQPSASATIIGTVRRNALLDVLSNHDEWLEIRFNQAQGYVAAKFTNLIDIATIKSGTVTAAKLNVRDKPNANGKIIGSVGIGSEIAIRGDTGDWYEFLFNGVPAYVSKKYVTTLISDDGGIPTAANQTEAEIPASTDNEIETISMEPADKLDVIGNSKSQKVASSWNKYGGLLTNLSAQYQIEAACIIAVMCVESSGDGFRQDNQGRMVIRFENHKFWSFWGKTHADEFYQYFKLDLTNKPWLGHKWRPSVNDEWMNFHGSQLREWQVLEFARRLDDTAALKSISMGAPQIMGFNYAQLGYANVQAMFDKFSADMRYQITGLFEFLSPTMLDALRQRDFTRFAGYYNGSGQKQQYGQWIDDHYQAFKNLTNG